MEQFKGTIKPKDNFDAQWSAERFRKALQGFGTDERVLINLLVSHDLRQRSDTEKKYKGLYDSDLIEDLKSELGGNFEETVLAMMMPPEELLATSLHEALTGTGIDEKTIIEIVCNRTPDEIQNLDLYYSRKYGRSVDEVIESNLTGDFHLIISNLVYLARDQTQKVDPIRARKEAQDLYDGGIGQSSNGKESQFTRILHNRSYLQLQETFREYETLSMEPIEKSINNEFSGTTKQGLLAIVQRVKDPLGFFAERLNESMRGAGTDDKTLIRIIVTRSEIDLEDIKKRYKEMYGSTLVNDVKADTSGDYGKLLMAIIGT